MPKHAAVSRFGHPAVRSIALPPSSRSAESPMAYRDSTLQSFLERFKPKSKHARAPGSRVDHHLAVDRSPLHPTRQLRDCRR